MSRAARRIACTCSHRATVCQSRRYKCNRVILVYLGRPRFNLVSVFMKSALIRLNLINKGTRMNINKAEKVEQAYDDVCWFESFSSEGCYRVAVDTAIELGGVEVFNSNDGNSSWSFAPMRTF